jgi:hypothetical protein
VTLTANAADSDGAVARVEFFAGATLLGTSSISPYSFSWRNAAPGKYTLTARAVDAAGAVAISAPVSVQVAAPPPRTSESIDEIVLYAADAPVIVGNWMVIPQTTAAGGARLQNPNAGVPKATVALAAPVSYFDLTFNAEAGKGYRLWVRARAQGDDSDNDSVHVQFDGSIDAAGAAVDRIDTTSSTVVVLEDCGGCGVSGWGWQDNGYGVGVLGPLVRFSTAGPQRMRIQVREDGIGIDQVVLSAVAYVTQSPGAVKNDTTILPQTPH